MTDTEDLPSWIELPPSSAPPPPISTLVDELPIHSLAWVDFERLCLRLARTQTDVIGARLFGVPGQDQEGIDLYARLNSVGTYRVYQCKRVEELSPSVIRSAVSLFLRGEWGSRAKSFVLCSTDSLRTTQRVNEVEKQTAKLLKKQIEFVVWAREDISTLLRDEPEIVFEFFGPSWVEQFCGPGKLSELRARRLVLEPTEVALLRERLSTLYRSVFATNDPGLAVSQQETPLGVYERYVIPDLLVAQERFEHIERNSKADWLDGRGSDPHTDETSFLTDHEFQQRRRRPQATPSSRRLTERGQRLSIDSFLSAAAGSKYVILAGPGGGKSALLRFLALDLLNADPQLNGTARMWGRFLPVWIPFGAWVEQTEKAGRIVPLSEMLRYWLRLFDESSIWPLVESALSDHRLILLVDGLDEWTSEQSARIALSQLNVFATQRGTPIVLTSRPHGFQQLATEFSGWKIGELAPLTLPQQTALAKVWFTKWLAADLEETSYAAVSDSVDRRASQAARDFVADVAKLPDLEDLATVPLLLSVLIVLHYQHAALPDDRFSAYKALTEQLISIWPRRRRAAALVGSTSPFQLSDSEREQAYSCLAFRTLVESPSGLIVHTDARRSIEDFLSDETAGLGFSEADAKRGARDLVQVGESVSGILVERSPRQLGFYHRALHEYLAAGHLASLPFEEQLRHVRESVSNVMWREVILALISMTRANTAVAAIISEIRSVAEKGTIPVCLHLRELLTEIAVGPFLCPPALSRELIHHAIEAISLSWWMPHRERVLHILLGGLRSRRLRPHLIPQVRRWFPERVAYREQLLVEVAEWPERELVQGILFQNLLAQDNESSQLAAAYLIAKQAPNESLKNELLRMARLPYQPRTRAAILFALIEGWGTADSVRRVLDISGNELTPEIRLLQIKFQLLGGTRERELIDELVALLGYTGVEYHWTDVLMKTILDHLSGDPYLREVCLEIVEDNSHIFTFSNERAWDILLEGYPQDSHVVAALVRELQKERPMFRRVDWSILSKNFLDNPDLISALDVWMSSAAEHLSPHVSGAALVGRTQVAKEKLLARLDKPLLFWPARALLDGWGMKDDDVKASLTAIAFGPNVLAAQIAHLLPRIIADPIICYSRLLDLLRDYSVPRTDRIIAGLKALDRITANQEVVDVVIARVESGDVDTWAMVGQTISDARDVAGVRELALSQLRMPMGAHVAVIHAFGHEPDVLPRVMELLTPLPPTLRLLIAEYIRDIRGADSELTDICRDYHWEWDAEVASAGAIAYARHRKVSKELQSDLAGILDRLNETGPLYHRYRQAAAAALIESQQAERLIQQVNPTGEIEVIEIPLEDYSEINRPLVRLILERWDYLSTIFAGRVLERFVGERFSSTEEMHVVWDWVAPYVDAYPIPSALLSTYCENISAEVTTSNILLFMARQSPRTILLRELCMKVLQRPLTNRVRDPHLLETAADILARQFSEDESVWIKLIERVSRGILDGGIVALGRAQPEASVLSDLGRRTPTKVLDDLPAIIYFRLICAAGTTSTLQLYVSDLLRRCPPEERNELRWLYRPLIERLGRDPELASALHKERLGAGPSALTTMLTSVMSVVPGLLKEEQLREELEQQASSFTIDRAGAVSGLDLPTGEVLPLAHLLLETLERSVR